MQVVISRKNERENINMNEYITSKLVKRETNIIKKYPMKKKAKQVRKINGTKTTQSNDRFKPKYFSNYVKCLVVQ